jgi:hypothetical protein
MVAIGAGITGPCRLWLKGLVNLDEKFRGARSLRMPGGRCDADLVRTPEAEAAARRGA